MPYKNKRDLYKAQKRYRARKKREIEEMKEKLKLYKELLKWFNVWHES